MNWWKKANIENFEDRNQINDRIIKFEKFVDVLSYAAKLVFQTPSGARKMVSEIRENKTISLYDDVYLSLSMADKCAIDSPKKFALFCNHAAQILQEKIQEFEGLRDDFVNSLSKNLKGLRDD